MLIPEYKFDMRCPLITCSSSKWLNILCITVIGQALTCYAATTRRNVGRFLIILFTDLPLQLWGFETAIYTESSKIRKQPETGCYQTAVAQCRVSYLSISRLWV